MSYDRETRRRRRMRNQVARELNEGRTGHYKHKVHGDKPRRRPSQRELFEEAEKQEQLMIEEYEEHWGE